MEAFESFKSIDIGRKWDGQTNKQTNSNFIYIDVVVGCSVSVDSLISQLRASTMLFLTANIVVLVLVLDIVVRPYLQRKLKNLFENCREDLADGIQCSNSNLTRLRNIFVNVYPILHLAVEVTNICKFYLIYEPQDST